MLPTSPSSGEGTRGIGWRKPYGSVVDKTSKLVSSGSRVDGKEVVDRLARGVVVVAVVVLLLLAQSEMGGGRGGGGGLVGSGTRVRASI